jgi:hypothetical protein
MPCQECIVQPVDRHRAFLPRLRHWMRPSDPAEAATDFLCIMGLAVACGALLTALALNGLFMFLPLIGAVSMLLDFRIGVLLLMLLTPQ